MWASRCELQRVYCSLYRSKLDWKSYHQDVLCSCIIAWLGWRCPHCVRQSSVCYGIAVALVSSVMHETDTRGLKHEGRSLGSDWIESSASSWWKKITAIQNHPHSCPSSQGKRTHLQWRAIVPRLAVARYKRSNGRWCDNHWGLWKIRRDCLYNQHLPIFYIFCIGTESDICFVFTLNSTTEIELYYSSIQTTSSPIPWISSSITREHVWLSSNQLRSRATIPFGGFRPS